MDMYSLTVFRNLLSDPVVAGLLELLSCEDKTAAEKISRYAAFVNKLFAFEVDLSSYLLKLVLEDENIYSVKWNSGATIDSILDECVENELRIIQALSKVTAAEVQGLLEYKGFLPAWRNSDYDFLLAYRKRLKKSAYYGFGIFAKYKAFKLIDGTLYPILHPDPIRLSGLKGYEEQRSKVINNTKYLLSGKPAANVLLYGDAGTGKSSTVKGIFNEFKNMGLRLVEVAKKDLVAIPQLLDSLYCQPLKFIIFIDDLTISKEQDELGTLKAILEGSVAGKPSNVVIYVTSNRRHLLQENWSDREGDDIHRNETIQEELSLSNRFGLAVFFDKPDKSQYLDIVCSLAEEEGLKIPEDILKLEAERFAARHSGRSPRTARQFIDEMLSKSWDVQDIWK